MTDSNNPYGLPPVPPPNPYSGQPQPGPYGSPPPNPFANPYNQGQAGYAPPSAPPPPNPFANPYNQGPGYGAPPNPGQGQGFNPYAPPSSGAQAPAWAQGYASSETLATPGSRLVARILDGLLFTGVMIVCMIPGIAVESEELAGGLAFLAIAALAIYQWFLMSTTGQSLGKKWMGVRMVKVDGSPVDFVSAVLLRSWVMQLLAFLGGLIVIGSILPLVDALMIFGDERRCLHDHIAGTKVIVA